MTTHRPAYWAAISLIIALIALITLNQGTAQAKIYKYRDDQGKLHFTDDKNNIPPQYRSGPQTEELRSITSPSSTDQPATPSSAGASGGDAKGDSVGSTGATGTSAEQVGLSEKDEKLAKESIAMLEKGVGLAKQYKGLPNNSRIGKKLYNAIQANLPTKESLVAKLAKSKESALVSAHSVLQKILASDQATQPIKPEMVRAIRNLINRIVSEGPAQAAMIKKLNQALKDSEKAKAEAEKKKAQEKSESSS
ncbi:MAG: DUF4124 domain-containing protein [Nitrospina sp.]|nr:MAG: DUF4124 domain-containing protein [Nitrospina sp.]